MRRLRTLLSILVPLFAFGVVTLALGGGALDVGDPRLAADDARIRAHLARVERDLRARDVGDLSPEQRAARERHLDVLHEYWTHGVFPRNTDFPGQRVPYFRDPYGTLCAVAFLIARSGREDLVDRVAATRNNAYVVELKGDPELVEWLAGAGLTLEEAARIQPEYDGCCTIVSDEDSDVGAAYGAASIATLWIGGASILVNAVRLERGEPTRGWATIGAVAGAAGIGLGLARLEDDGAARNLGLVNAAVGALSTGMGLPSLWKASHEERADIVIRPAMLASGDGSSSPGAIVRVSF